jgi:hypothetical protein
MYYDYDNNAILCDCEFTEESNVIGSICTHCKKREEIELAKPWHIEVKTIGKYLRQSENTSGINNKLPIIRTMFEFIMTRPIFISKNPNFRKTISNKIEEFIQIDEASSIKDILEQTKIFISNLSSRDDYMT